MASRFPAAWLDELRQRSDIVQVVSGYVSLKKNGRKHWGLCPFHGEKTASFSVDAEQQLYYCFGCKAGGNVITFIMEIEHLSFHEAVEFLAERAHMPLPAMERDEDYERRRTLRDRLLEANRAAARFYHEMLFRPEGASSLAYLRNRGLNDSVIRKFGLGAAPAEWDSLTRYLLSQGFSLEELSTAGLTVVREAEQAPDGAPVRPKRSFDMFRNRAVFPIIDQYGNVLAFGGRTLENRQPKYLNTSDTPVFNKRKGVYAANLLRRERHLDRVILVEGYMDVVSLTQFGVNGVCATLGTALTNEQARLLRRFAPCVYLAYDGDSAGQHAILRGLDILREEGIPARVLDFPDGLDPDEFIRRDGLEGFSSLPAITGEDFRIRRARDGVDFSNIDGKAVFARAVSEIIAPLEPVERERHIRDLMVQTGFDRNVILDQIDVALRKLNPNQTPVPSARRHLTERGEEPKDESGSLAAQKQLISLTATGLLPEDIAQEEDFEDPELKLIYRKLKQGSSVASLIEQAPDENSRSSLVSMLSFPETKSTDEMIVMANECVHTIRRASYEKRLEQIGSELPVSEGTAKAALLAEAQELTRKLQQLRI